MQVLIALLTAIPLIIAVDPVYLEVFPYAYFRGGSKTFKVQQCTYFSWVGSQIGSIRLHKGSCIKMYRSSDCTGQDCNGKTCNLAYPKLEEEVLSEALYHNLNSAQACRVYSRSAVCPNGTWVRRMDFAENDLRSGITIYCYEPGKSDPYVVINTNGQSLSSYSSQFCQGATRGIDIIRNPSYNFISKAEARCHYSDDIGSDTLQCDKTDALVGVKVHVEELSSVIKQISPVCRYVENPVKLCTPTDSYQPLVVCNNALGVTETTCQYQKTVGVGISNTLQTDQSIALGFYGDFGFGGSAGAGDALKAQFSAKLGFAAGTSFNWTNAATQTWNQQTSVQVTVATPPGVITTLLQVVGKCSFFDVYANFFKRIDKHGNSPPVVLLITEEEEVLKLGKINDKIIVNT